jgi:cobalt-zinc-cadmium efflux system protein
VDRTHHHRHEVHLAGNRLRIAFFLTLAILVVEALVGYWANSLALMSDAGHILTDVFALGLAWLALQRSQRPPDQRNTYGYQRAGILAALVNAILLIIIALIIGVEAYGRALHPEHVAGLPIIAAALLAILVNGFIALGIHVEGRKNLNVRAALLHVFGDMAASAIVIVSGLVILLTHAYIIDPILSWVIALLIAFGAWRIATETLNILMEATPRGLDVMAVAAAMREVPGVEDVHDLHIWALSDGFRLLSAHVTVPEQLLSSTATLLADLRMLLRQRFAIDHATIELECSDCRVPISRPIVISSDLQAPNAEPHRSDSEGGA